MRGIFRYGWIYLGALRRALEGWCRMAVRSRLKPLVQVGHRLREHMEKLVGGFEHGIKMGLVEAINGKNRATSSSRPRLSRSPILHAQDLPNLLPPRRPWAQVIL
ncbi:MAG: transposase [Candidatus Eisenbacteria bacterium]|nr:transposase [Candidatus Eisenbacteria bacterium]